MESQDARPRGVLNSGSRSCRCSEGATPWRMIHGLWGHRPGRLAKGRFVEKAASGTPPVGSTLHETVPPDDLGSGEMKFGCGGMCVLCMCVYDWMDSKSVLRRESCKSKISHVM